MTATERPARETWKPPYDYPLSDGDGDSYCIAVQDFSDKSRWQALRHVAGEMGEDVSELRARRGVVSEHWCEPDDPEYPDEYYCWCGGEGRDGGWSEWIAIKEFKASRKRAGLNYEIKREHNLCPAFIVTYR